MPCWWNQYCLRFKAVIAKFNAKSRLVRLLFILQIALSWLSPPNMLLGVMKTPLQSLRAELNFAWDKNWISNDDSHRKALMLFPHQQEQQQQQNNNAKHKRRRAATTSTTAAAAPWSNNRHEYSELGRCCRAPVHPLLDVAVAVVVVAVDDDHCLMQVGRLGRFQLNHNRRILKMLFLSLSSLWSILLRELNKEHLRAFIN